MRILQCYIESRLDLELEHAADQADRFTDNRNNPIIRLIGVRSMINEWVR